MDTTQVIITVVSSMLASSGLWGVLQYAMQRRAERDDKRRREDSAERKMLIALAHDRIYTICGHIIDEVQEGKREGVTAAEYNNLRILYEGYVAIGGNGTGKRLFDEVSRLPIV